MRNTGALIFCACLCPSALAAPPSIEPRPVTDTYFGNAVVDPFRHLENIKDPKVAAWMRAQADHARAALDRLPERAAFATRIAMYEEAVAARVADVQRRPGDLIFFQKRGAKDNQFKLYVRRGEHGGDRLLVDPDAIHKRTGQPHSIDWYVASTSGRYLAYGLSPAGSEDSELFVLETASGRRITGPISRTQYAGVSWLPDDTGLFFNRTQEMKDGMPPAEKYQKSRALFIPVGREVEDARSVFAFDTPGVTIDAEIESPYVVASPGTDAALGVAYRGTDRELAVYAAPLAQLVGGEAKWRKIVDRDDSVTAIEVFGDRLFALTHKNAPRYQLVETSIAAPDFATARVVMPQGPGVITGIARAADGIYVSRRDGSVSNLFRIGLAANARPQSIALPLAGSFAIAGTHARLPGVLITLESWTRAQQIYRVSGTVVSNTGLQPSGRYGAVADYVATEVLVPSHDGAKVPLSIIHKRGLKKDGRNPTLLYGYAAYGITEEPWFSLWRLAWLERGGVFAVANPRGSGAFGFDWYKDGFQKTKPNSWRDFIAVAEYLFDGRFTSPARLGIWGGSAGGVLVGRAMTERPDLFAAVIAQVGAFDLVRAELEANGVPNVAEFGSHKTEAGFYALLAMSTYHQINDGVKYPAVLLTHGVNDSRVDVWQSMKAAARLQQASASAKPVLLRLSYESGHGLGDTKEQYIAERADMLAFLWAQMGTTREAAVSKKPASRAATPERQR